MVMGCVFFAVQTECLNIIKTSFGFRGLISDTTNPFRYVVGLFVLGTLVMDSHKDPTATK
jgi:hypothetical protein